MDPLCQGSRVGLFHSTRDVEMEVAFFFPELVARGTKKLANNMELFRVSEAMWIVFRRAVDVLAATDPHGVGIIPKRSDEGIEPL